MVDAGTGWTDDRVELLGKLWAEGLSASQIAAALGGGVTRNAVIGKVHRLGLAGRAKSGQPSPARPVRPTRAPEDAPRPDAVIRTVVGAVPTVLGTAMLPPTQVRDVRADPEIPVSERVSIVDLRDTMCRWPLGDPTSAEFGFCGQRSVTGLPYCERHCRIAFQPAADRKRLRA